MECIVLHEKSYNRVTVTLKDENQVPVTDAVITLTLVDQNQEIVSGEAFPQTMDNEGAGDYSLMLPDDLGISRGNNYWAQIRSSSPSRGVLYQEVLCKCEVVRT